MLEIPEAYTLASQINELLTGKTIINVITNYSPHKFTCFYQKKPEYPHFLVYIISVRKNASGG